MFNKDLAYNDCNYRFKGKSCEDCELGCIYKNKNAQYRKYKAQEQQLNNCRYFKRPCADNNFNCIWKQNERLKEENEKLKKILQELEDLSLKTYDVADFQMYFDNLRGNNK